MKCYYHKVDLDGKCSAAIVKRKYPNCELIGVNYPDRPDFDILKEGETVFVVDFSFSPEDMYKLLGVTSDNLIWIDHHKSAIEKIEYTTLPDNNTSLSCVIRGEREIGRAGCELTWEYLFSKEPMPDAVKLLGRYDVWDHKNSEVLPFQYGMRMEEWEPTSQKWRCLFENPNAYMDYIQDGDTILAYENQQNTAYSKSMAFPVEFEGHKTWAINKALSNAKIFETIKDADKRPLWLLFNCRDGLWKYSLYSAPNSGIDVSQIAVKYGGGGHAGAAGFQSDKYLLNE